jgi:hypothetical protein
MVDSIDRTVATEQDDFATTLHQFRQDFAQTSQIRSPSCSMLHVPILFLCMRTTVDLPDELLRQARTRAAEEGTTLTALLTEGLRLRLSDAPPGRRRQRKLPTSVVGGGLQPWIDPSSNASLLDAADDVAAS